MVIVAKLGSVTANVNVAVSEPAILSEVIVKVRLLTADAEEPVIRPSPGLNEKPVGRLGEIL